MIERKPVEGTVSIEPRDVSSRLRYRAERFLTLWPCVGVVIGAPSAGPVRLSSLLLSKCLWRLRGD